MKQNGQQNTKGRWLLVLACCWLSGCLYWLGEPVEQMRLQNDPALIHRSAAHQQVASAILNVQQRCSNFQDSPMRWQLNYFYMAINACRYDSEGEEHFLTGCATSDYLQKSGVLSCLGAIVADPCEADRIVGGTALPAAGRLATYVICAKAFGSLRTYPVYSIY